LYLLKPFISLDLNSTSLDLEEDKGSEEKLSFVLANIESKGSVLPTLN